MEVETIAQAICAFHQLANASEQLAEEEKQRLQSLSERYEPPPFRL
jgi:hypothetical protein